MSKKKGKETKDLNALGDTGKKFLSDIARHKEISRGIFFIADTYADKQVLRYIAGYACGEPQDDLIIEFGEGFPGQVAKDGRMINISDIPEGYMVIESGLGKSTPSSLIIFPVKINDQVVAVVELASFHRFDTSDETYFTNLAAGLSEEIGRILN